MPVLEVLGWISADLIENIGQNVGAVEAQAGSANGVLLDLVTCFHHGKFKVLGVGAGHRAPADDSNSLQVFRAHHRAHAASAGGAVQIVHDAGEQHLVLAAWADARDLGIILGLGANGIRGVRHVLAPNMRSVANLDALILDPKIDRLRGRTLEDDSVVPGEFQFGSPDATGMRGRNGARERSFGHNGVATGGRSVRTGQRTWQEDQLVLWRQRVDFWIDLIGHDLRAEAARPDIFLGERRIQRFYRDLTRRQIDAKEFSDPPVHGLTPKKRP